MTSQLQRTAGSCIALRSHPPRSVAGTLVMLGAMSLGIHACSRRPAQGGASPPRGPSVAVITPTGPIQLPPPYHTRSYANMPIVGPRPAGAELRVPPGFHIAEFAARLDEPRWITVAPNGDVFVSEHTQNRITVLRDADHDGRPEVRQVFASGLHQPFGMAFHPDGWLYIGNTNGVVRLRYAAGQLAAAGAPEPFAPLPGDGYNHHWTRTVIFSPDARKMYVSVGSETNASVERDPRRGAINEFDVDGSHHRVFAGGLRNPVGIAFHPTSHQLFAVVNERDELGDDLVPDYLTSVAEGAFYGWPYSYFGAHEDPRHRGERPDLVARAVVPDLALGAHVAALGLAFYNGAQFPPEYRGDALIGLHGSWNRSQRVGYKVVRARFRNGVPTGQVDDFVSGWLTADQLIWGRPVGVAETSTGDVLIADDAGNKIWRVWYAP